MSFEKVCPDHRRNHIEIEIDKLIAFDDFPFEDFKGLRLKEMVDSVSVSGILTPIRVRPINDGRYEVLDGHYRVAAARELRLSTVSAIVHDGLSDEEALKILSPYSPVGLWIKYDIDICDSRFMESEEYKKHENDWFYSEDGIFLTLGEYITRFLLTERDLCEYEYYESIYSMGNPCELDEQEYEYVAVAKDIFLMLSNDDSEYAKKYNTPEKREDAIDELADTLESYIDLIKKYFDIDLNLYDYEDIQNRRERAKLLYFFYMMKNRDFPGINVLDLLKKPSMESIDNSLLGWKTYNGDIIHRIACSVRKELPWQAIKNIENALSLITASWDSYLDDLRLGMDALRSVDFETGLIFKYDFSEILQVLNTLLQLPKESPYATYDLSPIGTLYLRIMQYQYIGQVIDILAINAMQPGSDYNVPVELVKEMRKFHARKVNTDDIAGYIDDNAYRLAEYVYRKKNISKEERRKIRYHKDKVSVILDFCIRARPFENIAALQTELLIISCLQAILIDSSSETFDYIYSGYQRNAKHRPQVQGALKNNDRTVDALKVYWTRKVMDHWYANIGSYDLRCKLREVENACDSRLIEILSSPSISEMMGRHRFYFSKLNN